MAGRVERLPLLRPPTPEEEADQLFEAAAAAFSADREADAVDLLERLIAIHPGYADAYESLGVTFSLQDGPGVLPIICVEGNPVTGYNGGGADSPMSSGSGGLTDPIIDGDPFTPGGNIVMTFDPPVTSVRFFVIDIDGVDVFTARAFDGMVEVAVDTHSAGQAGTGNGVSTPGV